MNSVQTRSTKAITSNSCNTFPSQHSIIHVLTAICHQLSPLTLQFSGMHRLHLKAIRQLSLQVDSLQHKLQLRKTQTRQDMKVILNKQTVANHPNITRQLKPKMFNLFQVSLFSPSVNLHLWHPCLEATAPNWPTCYHRTVQCTEQPLFSLCSYVADSFRSQQPVQVAPLAMGPNTSVPMGAHPYVGIRQFPYQSHPQAPFAPQYHADQGFPMLRHNLPPVPRLQDPNWAAYQYFCMPPPYLPNMHKTPNTTKSTS